MKDESWRLRTRYWRNRLEDCRDYPTLSSLKNSWELLRGLYGDSVSEDDAETVSGNPLDALFYFVEAGFYPPPELLLALLDRYELYISAHGQMTLEKALIGPPVRRIGNRSAQLKRNFDLMELGIEMMSSSNQGLSQIKIAENYVAKHNLKVDPDSLLRNWRRTQKLWRKR